MKSWANLFATALQAPLLTAVLLLAAPSAASLELDQNIKTHADGRLPIQSLYAAYEHLLEQGWLLDVVGRSQPEGRPYPLPIIALRTPQTGRAVWILAGIHGEEPAGPNAIAATIDEIAALGAKRPVVLLPLNNPHGYVQNWRYLNMATYSEAAEGQSVGDSSHLLPDPENPSAARAPQASSAEADALTSYVLALSASYPPAISIDLHEDNLISEGYVYSQGVLGAADPLALAAVRVLVENGILLKTAGETRFGESIDRGIIGPVVDSSIDELMGSTVVIAGGRPQPGPSAETVLVFETPADAVELPRRVDAHAALLRKLALLLAVTVGLPDAGLDSDKTTEIYLVRHAEKEAAGPNPGLSAAGRQRAAELARLLRGVGIDAIYSTNVARTLETATPLAAQQGLKIRFYDWDDMEALAASLLRQGGRYLVVGHSDTTPELVGLLGGEPGTPIDEADEYDRLYVVTVDSDGKVTSELRRFGTPFSP